MIEKVSQFVRRNAMADRRDGACRKFVLRHQTGGKGGGAQVSMWEVESHHRHADSANALAEEISMTAESDASGIGGTQRYVLHAYHGESEKPTDRLTFRVDGDEEGDSDDFSSEPANAKGVLSQMMRHNEAMMKGTLMGLTSVMTTMQRQMAKQADRLEHMETDRFRTIEVMERLFSQEHQRKLELQKQESRESMTRELMGKLQLFLPVVANKIAGKQLMPAPVNEVLTGFLNTLSPEQAATIFGALNDEQRHFLQEFMSAASGDGAPQ